MFCTSRERKAICPIKAKVFVDSCF